METAQENPQKVFEDNGQPIASSETIAPKRNVVNRIFVFYADQRGHCGLSDFDTKPEMDAWVEDNGIDVLRVVKGKEKKIKRSSKVTFL